MKFPWISILPVLFALIVGQLGRFGGNSGSTTGGFLLIDFAIGWYVVITLTLTIVEKRKLIISFPQILFGIFGLWALASLFLNRTSLEAWEFKTAFLYWVRLAALITAYLLTPTFLTTEKNAHRLVQLILQSGTILLLLGYVQLILFPNFNFMAKYGWDPHEGRLLSTFFDPNYFGMFLTMLISLLVARFFTQKTAWYWWVITLLALVAQLLTYSRSAYLSLFVSLVIIIGIRTWRIMALMLVIATVIAFQVPRVKDRVIGAFSVDPTSQARIISWKNTLDLIGEKPLVGVGYNAYGPANLKAKIATSLAGRSTQGGDSGLLFTTATTGFIGLGIYLTWILFLFWQAVTVFRLKISSDSHTLALASIGIIPAYIVHSQFVNGLYYPLLVMPFLLLMSGLTLSLYKPSSDR